MSQKHEIQITDMSCSACVAHVEKALAAVDGVSDVSVDLIGNCASITGGELESLMSAVIKEGYGARPVDVSSPSQFFLVINDEIPPKDFFIAHAEITLFENENNRIKIETTEAPGNLLSRLKKRGTIASIEEDFVDPLIQQAKETAIEIKKSWQRAFVAGISGMALMTIMMNEISLGSYFWMIASVLVLGIMWFSGGHYYVNAIKQARHGSANMDTLVALGTSAAWISSALVIFLPNSTFSTGHIYLEAAVLILAFLQFGHALEIRAKRVTSEAIASLLKLIPKKATLLVDDEEFKIPVSLLRRDDLVRVFPGETVPIDGRIIDGESYLNESMLTGEVHPVEKKKDDLVTGGSENKNGSFVLSVKAVGDDTTLAHIISMVKQAQLSKPRIQKMVDKVSAIFVPIVVLISIVTFFVWWSFGPVPELSFAVTAAIAVLVIACPCALGLATPIAIMMGTARAAHFNILIRNSDALQNASRLTHVVVDKTGTLTQGTPVVTEIVLASDTDETQVLSLASSLESGSDHPLAEAISKKAEAVQSLKLSSFKAHSGLGVEGVIESKKVLMGNAAFMVSNQVAVTLELEDKATNLAEQGSTPVWLASDGKLLALFMISDVLRDDSDEAIKQLQKRGLKVVMCSGDNQVAVNAIAKQLNIDEVHAQLLPSDKLNVIKSLQKQGHVVAMVGDGVNDAPALACADVGFAIGSGTDIAVSNADITLAGDSLMHVNTAIAISTLTVKNIKQNLFGAFIYNVIGIPLAAGLFYPLTGWLLEPTFASIAMALSSVTVVTNANRLRFFKPDSV